MAARLSPMPLVIDTDPGCDDVLAILLALSMPQIDVRAITLVAGNTSLENGTRNLATLMDVLWKHMEAGEADARRFAHSKPVIAVGAEKPLERPPVVAESFHGSDGLGNLHATHPHLSPSDWSRLILASRRYRELEKVEHEGAAPPLYTVTTRDASDELLWQLQHAEEKTVTILAIGPLTNLALALRRNRKTFARAKQIVVKGGAIAVPGNVTPVAEFNFYADPDAAKEVLSASLPCDDAPGIHVTLVPTDVTNTVRLPASVLSTSFEPLSSPLAKFTGIILAHMFKVMARRDGVRPDASYVHMHDPLAAGVVCDLARFGMLHGNPPGTTAAAEPAGGKNAKTETPGVTLRSVWKTRWMDVRVETRGEITAGMCVVDRRAERLKKLGVDAAEARKASETPGGTDKAHAAAEAWGLSDPPQSKVEVILKIEEPDAWWQWFLLQVYDIRWHAAAE